MPPAVGKYQLRCVIPQPLYRRLVEEANSQRVEIGLVVTARLEQSYTLPLDGADAVTHRLDVIQQRQEQLLDLFEALVRQLQPTSEVATDAPESPPMATYADIYREPQGVPEETPSAEPPKRKWWR